MEAQCGDQRVKVGADDADEVKQDIDDDQTLVVWIEDDIVDALVSSLCSDLVVPETHVIKFLSDPTGLVAFLFLPLVEVHHLLFHPKCYHLLDALLLFSLILHEVGGVLFVVTVFVRVFMTDVHLLYLVKDE